MVRFPFAPAVSPSRPLFELSCQGATFGRAPQIERTKV
jgi:hypothetical protein